MKGNVDFDDVNTTGSKADDVSITAVSVDGTVDVGAIYANGDVVVDATNATGEAKIGSVYGQTVKLDVRGSASTSTIAATQYAEKSADISVNELAAARTGSGYTIAATTLTAATTKALAVKFNGGINQDNLTINGASTTTSITVTGDLGAGTEEVAINAGAATAKTVDISGLLKYETSTIRTGAGADTIVGGVGADIIVGGAGADTMTGGAGNDVFVINSGDSSSTAPDTIVDFLDGDVISFGGETVTKATQEVSASASVATISTLGVATFGLTSAANKETFAQVYALVDAAISTNGASALFSFGGSTYLFISQDTTGDAVVKLTGVAIPTTSATQIASQGSGLGGFGA
jgi:Ca2+-binding RTX toxin-like protein